MRRMSFAGVVVAVMFLSMADTALAASVRVCVPKKEGNAVLTPKHGKCKKRYTPTSLGTEGKRGAEGKAGPEGRAGPAGTAGLTGSELETLERILPHIKYVAFGIGGKPTVQLSGVNVQLVNGEGNTRTANGVGNLVIGYDEHPGEQTGSHDLVLGVGQEFTSVGGIVAGAESVVSAPFASVTGGSRNEATGELASVTGGAENLASAPLASISGGVRNRANGVPSSVSGGYLNSALGLGSSIFGGTGLTATEPFQAIP